MPMPIVDNDDGGILGAVRRLMQSDLNIAQWFTDDNGKFNVRPGLQKTKVAYPYCNMFIVGSDDELDSVGSWGNKDVQLSIFGEGYDATRYVKQYVYQFLNGKGILLLPVGTTLQGTHNAEPMVDRERSAGGSDIYHALLRFRCKVQETRKASAS